MFSCVMFSFIMFLLINPWTTHEGVKKFWTRMKDFPIHNTYSNPVTLYFWRLPALPSSGLFYSPSDRSIERAHELFRKNSGAGCGCSNLQQFAIICNLWAWVALGHICGLVCMVKRRTSLQKGWNWICFWSVFAFGWPLRFRLPVGWLHKDSGR
jgi:hypothetical protein